ncbi:flagellin N-terminal-like domain-containing protein [Halorientalis persicus]|uniref:Flagellin N-terminal-like domain-containing protein n=1 Tax=Halorientalis persicus TaxID=1367881 RepID=A0A1H8IQB3_9EURY|nr:type IV pilin [Halorientalis persicus]SEN70744.1 flagellin N-terminal-like domain-containing protein [Halorientalis persicus]
MRGFGRGRGQSEVIGSLLLVAVGVVLIGAVAVLGFSLADDTNRDPTTASLSSSVSAGNVTLVHTAGDGLSAAETVAVLRHSDDARRVRLSSLAPVAGGDDDQITAGDRYRLPHDVIRGELAVTVVHEESGAVLHTRQFWIADGIAGELITADADSLSDFQGNVNDPSATTTISDGGRRIEVTGNKWQLIGNNYTVTEDTVLTFEFRSTTEGAIHGIGFQNAGSGQDSGRVVQLSGVQKWGVNVSDYGGSYYKTGDGWTRYEVPIGEVYRDRNNLGAADSLLIVNDCDGNEGISCGSHDSAYRNVAVSESD